MMRFQIVSMDGRTIYASEEVARYVATIYDEMFTYAEVRAIDTGAAWAVEILYGGLHYGWAFDGAHSR